MKRAVILVSISLLLILAATQAAFPSDSRSIRISITIPAIIGVNTPAPSDSALAEETIIGTDTIVQTEQSIKGNKKYLFRTFTLK